MAGIPSDGPLIAWVSALAGPSKTERFGAAHAASCPVQEDPESYVRWAKDSAFTAKMAKEYEDGDEDRNRAEFWDSVCRFLMRKAGRSIPGLPDALSEEEYAQYVALLDGNLTGPEQTAMRERSPDEYEAWLDVQLKHVAMPSFQKPDINGLREGDRVILTQPFSGESLRYERLATGILIITSTAPAQIRLARTTHLVEVLMDDMGVIGVDQSMIRTVGVRVDVMFSADGTSVGIRHFGHIDI